MKHTVIKAELYHAQAIEGEETLWFNKARVVQFSGDNSNGKSIFFKMAEGTIKQRFTDKDYRLSMINYDWNWAEILFYRSDGAILKTHIDRESADSYYELIIPGKDKIKRNIKDSVVSLLVAEFGFHYDKDTNISLNIYATFDPVLFITTSPTENDKVIKYAVTSAKAEYISDNAKETIKTLDNTINKNMANKDRAMHVIASLPKYDVKKIEEDIQELKPIIEIGKCVKPLYLRKLKQLPTDEVVSVVNSVSILELSIMKNTMSSDLGVISSVLQNTPNTTVINKIRRIDCSEELSIVNCVPKVKILDLLNSKKQNTEELAYIANILDSIDKDFKIKDISESILMEFSKKEALEAQVCPECGKPYFSKEGVKANGYLQSTTLYGYSL